jgi:hypothetical protein
MVDLFKRLGEYSPGLSPVHPQPFCKNENMVFEKEKSKKSKNTTEQVARMKTSSHTVFA